MIIIAKSKKKNRLKENNHIIAEIRKQLKEDSVVIEMCQEQGYPVGIIDGVVLTFADDIEVSAKTVNSEIYLNEKLKSNPDDDQNWPILMRYAVHELTHALQHMEREGLEDSEEGKNYLDRDDELEAFQFQIQFDLKERGPEDVIEYVEDLLEYHEVHEDEADDKKQELFGRVTK